MSPIGNARTKRFNFVVTEAELAMLNALAAEERRTAGDWLRVMIHSAYVAKFGDKKPKR